MKLASSGYFKAVGVLRLFHTQADIGVQFAQKTVAQVTGSNEFSFSSCKRAVIDDELHGDRRFGNLLEWNGFRILRLAARLTGYKIDIKSETQAIESGELPEDYMDQMNMMEEDGYAEDYEETVNYTDGYPEDADAYEEIEFVEAEEE